MGTTVPQRWIILTISQSAITPMLIKMKKSVQHVDIAIVRTIGKKSFGNVPPTNSIFHHNTHHTTLQTSGKHIYGIGMTQVIYVTISNDNQISVQCMYPCIQSLQNRIFNFVMILGVNAALGSGSGSLSNYEFGSQLSPHKLKHLERQIFPKSHQQNSIYSLNKYFLFIHA